MNTVDFIKKIIVYYGYKPIEIETDNSTEFTWNQNKIKKIYSMDKLCLKENIFHHTIRPRTPRHNGRIKRSHKNNNERFYNFIAFYSLENLRKQEKQYLKGSNTIPMAILGYKSLYKNEMNQF